MEIQSNKKEIFKVSRKIKMEENELQELLEQKCIVADCEKKQGMYMQMGIQMVPVCSDHFMKFMEVQSSWQKASLLVHKDMQKSNGETIIIRTYEEWKEKVKQHFQDISTQGLVMTKGVCIECGEKALSCRFPFKPVCEEHMEFPLNVLKVALK